MAEKKEEEQKQAPVMIAYVEQEVDYQEDLLGKLMAVDHVLSMFSRDDPPVFRQHMEEIKTDYQQRYNYFITLKRQGVQFPESMGYAPVQEQGQEEETDKPQE